MFFWVMVLGVLGGGSLPGRTLPFHLDGRGPWSLVPPGPGVNGWSDGAALSQQMAEAEAAQLKEEGNRHFQRQDYKAATKSYSQALKLTKDKALLAILYRNRAACGLKMVWGKAGGRGPGRGCRGAEAAPFVLMSIMCPLSS